MNQALKKDISELAGIPALMEIQHGVGKHDDKGVTRIANNFWASFYYVNPKKDEPIIGASMNMYGYYIERRPRKLHLDILINTGTKIGNNIIDKYPEASIPLGLIHNINTQKPHKTICEFIKQVHKVELGFKIPSLGIMAEGSQQLQILPKNITQVFKKLVKSKMIFENTAQKFQSAIFNSLNIKIDRQSFLNAGSINNYKGRKL